MSDLFDRVTGDQDIFSKLLSKIPGFDGYMKKKNRRFADKILRENVANHYEQIWARLSGLQRDLISAGELSFVDDVEAVAIKLRQFIDRIRTASYGYSAFFAAVKIKEDDLARVYEYDLALFELGEEMSRAVDHIEASIGTEGLKAAIRNAVQVAQKCVDAFEARAQVMVGPTENSESQG